MKLMVSKMMELVCGLVDLCTFEDGTERLETCKEEEYVCFMSTVFVQTSIRIGKVWIDCDASGWPLRQI